MGQWVVGDLVVEWRGDGAGADIAADRFWAAGATAVGVVDDDGAVTLTASYPTPEAARRVAEELGARLVEITDWSWRDAWRRFAAPVQVAPDLVVTPSWVAVAGDEVVVAIDPGWCFGSGSHASTRLVLGWLARDRPAGRRVLDVGTGSGILAVAAARLGAASVVAVDIDPESAGVTRANAERNGVASLVVASSTPVAEVGSGFDLALVNVTAGVHAELARAVVAAVRPGARLLLAGLLPGQWRHVAGAYDGCAVVETAVLDGWEGLVLQRADAAATERPLVDRAR